MNDKPLMTRRELALYLGVTVRTLDRYRQDHDFGEVRIGATVRFRRSAIEAIESTGHAPKRKPTTRRNRR